MGFRIKLTQIDAFSTLSCFFRFGFMLTTAFVSMFISNAASTAMMVPIVEAFAEVTHQSDVRIECRKPGMRRHNLHFRLFLI